MIKSRQVRVERDLLCSKTQDNLGIGLKSKESQENENLTGFFLIRVYRNI